MTILLTNDDGIQAKSIRELKEVLSDVDNCVVVAPASQKSASAHAISIAHDIEVSDYYYENDFFGFQVEGTPADCVKLALCEIMKEPPAIIVSGINRGPNTGVSVYYSGTVSAAREGTIAGIPSIAVSMCSCEYDNFTYACVLVKKIVTNILQKGLPEGIMLNINIPPLREQEIKGIRIARQAPSRFVEKYIHRGENKGCTRYTLTGKMELVNAGSDNDEQTVRDGYVSITPLKLDLTSFSSFKEIENLI
ncbi:MAG: 5'/3'-nucleotidase SurE [Candidatus Omnitrophica bacterium]|nr:5'/3'-nucleotidase SurE [Candidatus Omnitrophota bacterium]